MKYLITRDRKEDEQIPICLWHPDAVVYEEDDLWHCQNPTMLMSEYSIEDFEEKYGPCTINPGESLQAQIVVHWLDE